MNLASKHTRPRWIHFNFFLGLMILILFIAIFPLARSFSEGIVMGLFLGGPVLLPALVIFFMVKKGVSPLVYLFTMAGSLAGLLLGIFSLTSSAPSVGLGIFYLFATIMQTIVGCSRECMGVVVFMPTLFIFSFTVLGLFVGLVIKRWVRASNTS